MLKKERFLFIDVLKIFSAYFVVVNHTIGSTFQHTDISFTHVTGVLLFVISKVAVPLFFLCSGFLFFIKPYTIQKSVKGIMKYVIILVLMTTFYFLFDPISQIEVHDLPFYFYSREVTRIIWFMFSYIGLLFMAPYISLIVRNLSKRQFLFLILSLILILNTFPVVLSRLGLENFNYWLYAMLPNPLYTYVFLGAFFYIIREYINKYRISILLISVLVIILSWFGTTFLMIYEKVNNTSYGQLFWDNRVGVHILLLSVSVFLLTMCICPNTSNEIITKISTSSFFIFLLSDFFIDVFHNEQISFHQNLFIDKLILSVFVFLISLFIGLCLTILFKRLKKVSK